LEYATTYFWRVQSNNACGDGAWSDVFSFTTEYAPGACMGDFFAVTQYETDLEDGAPGWTHEGTGDTWVLTDTRTTSGVNAWHALDPETLSDQRLVSPPIVIPGDHLTQTLQFQNYQAFERQDDDGRCWDGGILEATIDAGASWSQVPNSAMLTDPYDDVFHDNNPIYNDYGATDAWCAFEQDWTLSFVDVSAYGGETVQFRWRLGSDGAAGNEGWYLDDVVVQSCTDQYDVYLPTVLNGAETAATQPESEARLPFSGFLLLPPIVGLGLIPYLRSRRSDK
jgi:hypothetical protein